MKTALLALMLPVAAAAATLTFPTGAPRPVGDFTMVPAVDESSYMSFPSVAKKGEPVVPIVKKPAGLSSSARYGCGIVTRGKDRCWILDGSFESGWSIYVDWRGDGDLSDAAPQKFRRVQSSEWPIGTYSLDLQVDEGDFDWTLHLRVSFAKAPGGEPIQRPVALAPPFAPAARGDIVTAVAKDFVALYISAGAERFGTVQLEGKQYPFRLTGTRGRYDTAGGTLSIDRFGEGGFDRYTAGDRFLNLGGRSFEFSIDPAGASLSLNELAEARPGRAELEPNSPAPVFSVRDMEGMPHSLPAYKGRMLLIAFWSTACRPCREEAPRLLELSQSLPRGILDVLGVTSDASVDAVREFVRRNKLPWPQILEPSAGALHRMFRLDGEPTYYLIGSSGQILAGWTDPSQTVDQVTRFMTLR